MSLVPAHLSRIAVVVVALSAPLVALSAPLGVSAAVAASPPAAPRHVAVALTGPSAASRSWSATVSWASVSGAARYRLTNAAGSMVWTGTATDTRRVGLRPGIRYTWRLQAVGSTGLRSVRSAPVSATPPPAVPAGLAATVTADAATLRWRKSPGAAAYLVAPVSADGRVAGPLRRTTGTSLLLTGLVPGATSSWSAAAAAADGTRSAWSVPVTLTAPVAAPIGVTATVVTPPTSAAPAATVRLSWNPSPGAASYRVRDYRGRLIFAGSGTSTDVRGLSAGTRYSFTVAAVNPAGVVSRPSAPATVVVPRLPDPATRRETLIWDGLVRTFYVAVPAGPNTPAGPAAPEKPRPAVVFLHGDNDTAPRFLATTRVLAPALAAGEVVLAPETVGGVWNDGRLDPLGSSGPPGRDDVGFVLAALDTLVQQGVVDPTRVTFAGYSNGAGLAMRIAAEDPGRVAELVSFSGALIADGRAVLPRDPVPTVLVHGDADPTQPWDGRDRISALLPAQMSQLDTRRAWQGADVATGAAVTSTVNPPAWAPTLTSTTVQAWTGLAPLTFYRILGGTHRWPYKPCALGANTGCSADVRTDGQAESVDATALLVAIAATAATADR